jgi:hypothetical protein
MAGHVLASWSPELSKWLEGIGVASGWSRVIIDIDMDSAVKVYVEQYATTKILDFTPPELKRAEVKIV